MQKEKLKYNVKQKKLKEPIYNRQEEESDAAWHSFCVWRDMPDDERTTRAVSAKMGKSRQIIERWIYQWSWRKRLVAWQNEQIAGEMDELKAQHAKSLRDNIALATAFKSEVYKYIKWFKDNKTDMLEGMNPKDVVWMFQQVINLERQMYDDLIVREEKSGADGAERIIFEF